MDTKIGVLKQWRGDKHRIEATRLKPETLDRRLFMLKEYGKSFSLKEVVEITATKFGCEKPSLYTDWARRDKWLKEICNFQKANTHVREIVISFNSILKELDDLIKNADNSNCKLGALKLSINTRFKMIELLEHLQAKERDEIRIEEADRIYPDPIASAVRARLSR